MQRQGWPSSCFDHHDEDSAADVDYEDDYDEEEEMTNDRSTSRTTLFSILSPKNYVQQHLFGGIKFMIYMIYGNVMDVSRNAPDNSRQPLPVSGVLNPETEKSCCETGFWSSWKPPTWTSRT